MVNSRGCIGQIIQQPFQQPYIGSPFATPTSARPLVDLAKLMQTDPTTKQAEAIQDLAAAIRELADVIFHVGAPD